MRKILLSISIPLFFCHLTYAQSVYDGFEGNGNIVSWIGVSCNINTSAANPYPDGINNTATVLEYHDAGGQYAQVFFDIDGNFQLSDSAKFSFKIYVPSSELTGSQTNQVMLKLQDINLDEPWSKETTITKSILLDQWQTVTFDFATDSYVNADPYSKPPVQRIDLNRVVIQVNGYDNYDHVLAFIDDFSYSSNLVSLSSNDRFEFLGLPSEQEGADVLMTMLNNNYSRIADSLGTELSKKIYVYVYPGNDDLHIGIGWPDAPDWVVGTASESDRIDIVNPYKSSSHNFDQVSGIVIHEMVHCFVYGLADDTYPPIWLNEGAATYLAAETQPEFSPGFCQNVDLNNGRVLTLDELNNGATFGNVGGYGLSANIAEFIINRLGGSEVLGNFIKSKGLDYSILGFSSKQEFQDEWHQYVYVNYNCDFSGFQAAFSANKNTGKAPFIVNFTDFSVHGNNAITSWSWDFDNDGVIESTSQNPTWTYEQPGNYTVKLTVGDGSLTSSYTKNNYIEVLTPQVNDSLIFYKDFEDQSLTSDGWSSVNVTGSQVWEVSNDTYGYNDSYCGVMSGFDNAANVNENWLISPPFSPNSYQNLRLSFWNTSGYSGPNLELFVTDSYTGDPVTTSWTKIENVQWHDGNTYWEWTFSGIIDLSSLAGPSSQIAFKYTSTDNSASTWEIDNIILSTSIEELNADFTADVTSGDYDLTVNFTDNTIGDVSTWSWDFGDGGSSTEQNPSHTYTAAGSYAVSLSVTGAGGSDIETKTDYITITVPAPIADFTADVTSGNYDLTVSFTDNTNGDVSTWSWDFGDGGSSTEQNPSHTYTAAGSYAVSLSVTGAGGSDIEIKTDYITVSAPTDILDLKNKKDILIFPNPATTKLYVSSIKPIDLTIYTIQGQEILERRIDKQGYINIAGLTKGVYLVILKNKSETVTKKLIIE